MNNDRGPWVTTRSGARFYLADPQPNDYNISDIAAGLSKDCRYGGQLAEDYDDDIYSVAQHSVYVDLMVAYLGHPEARPWAILHDGPEGIYGDMTSPQKSISPDYQRREALAEASLIQKYGIPMSDEIRQVVHRADKMVSIMEAEVLTTTKTDLWSKEFMPVITLHELDPEFYCWRPLKARQEFLQAAYNQFGRGLYDGTPLTHEG